MRVSVCLCVWSNDFVYKASEWQWICSWRIHESILWIRIILNCLWFVIKRKVLWKTQLFSVSSHSVTCDSLLSLAGMYFLLSSECASSCWCIAEGRQPPSHCVSQGPKSKHVSAGNASPTSVSPLHSVCFFSSLQFAHVNSQWVKGFWIGSTTGLGFVPEMLKSDGLINTTLELLCTKYIWKSPRVISLSRLTAAKCAVSSKQSNRLLSFKLYDYFDCKELFTECN